MGGSSKMTSWRLHQACAYISKCRFIYGAVLSYWLITRLSTFHRDGISPWT